MDIKSHLLKNFSTQTNEEQKRKTLQKSVKAVEKKWIGQLVTEKKPYLNSLK